MMKRSLVWEDRKKEIKSLMKKNLMVIKNKLKMEECMCLKFLKL
jgi:hypothetical protein